MPLHKSGSRQLLISAQVAVFIVAASFLAAQVGCSSSNGGGSPSAPTVTVTSSASMVLLGNQVQFTAQVTGTTNTAVTWSVNEVAGGNSTVGTISASGVYTAPGDLPNPANMSISATSQADTSTSGSASITVTSDVVVTLATNPANTMSVPTNQSLQLTAVVASAGKPDLQVSWNVNGIANGNATVGTISVTGAETATYTAPAALPTPFKVSVQAISMADPSKIAAIPIVVAGMISSVSGNISAAAGGTLTLPDGSSATIPPGLLASDQTVTLSEESVPLSQPPGPVITGVGPALYLAFSGPLQQQAIRESKSSAINSGQLAGISFNFNFGVNLPSLPDAGAALASFVNQAGQTVFEGVSGIVNSVEKTGQAVVECAAGVGQFLANPPLVVGAFFVVLTSSLNELFPPLNAPKPGLLLWQQGDWVPFTNCPQIPSSRTLLVVHGMLSSVEGSFKQTLPDGTNGILGSKLIDNYDVVFGFDYDWSNGIADSGGKLADALDLLASCSAGNPIDIMAHSEGVPVSLFGVTQAAPATQPAIGHVISVAGPTLGTPVANVFAGVDGPGRFALLTILASFPPLQSVPPTCELKSILRFLDCQFAKDLATDSSGSNTLTQLRTNLVNDSALSKLDLIMVGGTNPDIMLNNISVPLDILCRNCFGIFQNEPFDGIVGLDSAFGAGLDFSLYRIPSFPLSHIDLVNNVTKTSNEPISSVVDAVVSQLTSSLPPALSVSAASPPASCEDNRFCSGPGGSVLALVARGFSPNRQVQIYTQDPTGTQDDPISIQTDSSGAVTWTAAIPCSTANGIYGIWLYDSDPNTLLASNSVIEEVTNGTCVAATPFTLTVASANPNGGAAISVSPGDANGQGNGTTQFTRTYLKGTMVTLIASLTSGGNSFSTWTGCDTTSHTACAVGINASRTVTANYVTPTQSTNTLTVSSTNPGSGAAITVSPADSNGQTSGNTPFTLIYNSGTSVTLTAADAAGGNNFSSWTGCDSPSGITCMVAMNTSRRVTANYVAPGTSTLTVASSNPSSGVAVTASPADNNGQANGTTQFTLTYNNGIMVSLSAASSAGTNSFSTWSGCDSVSGTSCTVTMSVDRTVTANYAPPGKSPGFAYVANQNSNDVSAYKVDSSTGALTPLTPIAAFNSGLSPASVAADPTGHCLYIANQQDLTVQMTVYTIDASTGELTPDPGLPVSVSEVSPIAIAFDPAGTFLFVANQATANVSVFAINAGTCALTEVPSSPTPSGSLPSALAVDPTGTFLYVTNLGDNDMSGFRINSSTGALTPLGSPFPTGALPNSVAIHPSGKFAFAANAGDNTISVYGLNPSTGALTSVSGSPFPTDLGPFSVAVEPTGKFVYVANLGALGVGEVSAFSINTSTGILTPVSSLPFPAGSMSGFAACDPSGKFAYVANYGSTGVSAFQIDPSTGALTPIAGSPFQAGGGPISIAITVLPGP